MAASDTDIANLALTKLGSPPISALTDDTKAARTMSAVYAAVRDDEMRGQAWKFAMARVSLPALVDAPAFGYGTAFTLPSDLLRLVQIGDDLWIDNLVDYRGAGNAAFQVDGSTLLTDLGAPLPIRYVKRETDVAKYDASFVQMLACKLAAECCEAITQSPGKKQLLLQEYELTLRKARRSNAIEMAPETAPDDSWIVGRL